MGQHAALSGRPAQGPNPALPGPACPPQRQVPFPRAGSWSRTAVPACVVPGIVSSMGKYWRVEEYTGVDARRYLIMLYSTQQTHRFVARLLRGIILTISRAYSFDSTALRITYFAPLTSEESPLVLSPRVYLPPAFARERAVNREGARFRVRTQ